MRPKSFSKLTYIKNDESQKKLNKHFRQQEFLDNRVGSIPKTNVFTYKHGCQ